MTSTDSSGRKPFHRIKEVNRVQNEVRQMQSNLRELQSELRELEWGLLGGMAVFDPAEAHKLCIATSKSMETIAGEINELPRSVEDATSENTGTEGDE